MTHKPVVQNDNDLGNDVMAEYRTRIQQDKEAWRKAADDNKTYQRTSLRDDYGPGTAAVGNQVLSYGRRL